MSGLEIIRERLVLVSELRVMYLNVKGTVRVEPRYVSRAEVGGYSSSSLAPHMMPSWWALEACKGSEVGARKEKRARGQSAKSAGKEQSHHKDAKWCLH